MKFADVPMSLEGRERAPKPVSLVRCEPRANDGDLHRLLLKQWHAHGLAQHSAQFI